MFTLRLLTIVLLIQTTYGYKNGAPKQACEQMTPAHGKPPQTDTSPYSLTVELPSSTYLLYRVTMSKEQSAPNFKGFLLKARPNDGTTADYIGEFVSYPAGTKLGECGNKRQSVTHENNQQKNSAVMEWAPTISECGTSVVFQATVVQSFQVFWTNVLSSKIDIPANCSSLLPTTQAPATQAPTQAPTTECDKTMNKDCKTSSANIPMVTSLYFLLVLLAFLGLE